MEMQNIAVNSQITPRDQTGQVLSLSRNHVNKIDDMPFIDNYDYLNALENPGGHPKSPTCGHLKIPHPPGVFKT